MRPARPGYPHRGRTASLAGVLAPEVGPLHPTAGPGLARHHRLPRRDPGQRLHAAPHRRAGPHQGGGAQDDQSGPEGESAGRSPQETQPGRPDLSRCLRRPHARTKPSPGFLLPVGLPPSCLRRDPRFLCRAIGHLDPLAADSRLLLLKDLCASLGGVSDFLRLGEQVPQKKVLGRGGAGRITGLSLTVPGDGSEKQEVPAHTYSRVLWCCFCGWWRQSGAWGRHGD